MLAWKKPRPLMLTVLRLAKLQTNPTICVFAMLYSYFTFQQHLQGT